MLRLGLAVLTILLGVCIGVVGTFGWASAGICDTSCPSDAALVVYKVMFWLGGAAIVVGMIALVVSLIRLRRARQRRL